MISPPSSSYRPSTSQPGAGSIGLVAAVAIGIGGMVGAGIFSILGVVAQAAGNAMWLAFAIGGVVALLSTYSYAKLGATFPSAGGAVHFLVKGFGDGVLAGGLNLFMWTGYIISLALYATAFGSYARHFRDHGTFPAADEIAGRGRSRRSHRGECIRRQNDGSLGDADRGGEGRDPRPVRGRRRVVYPTRIPLTAALAADRIRSCSVPACCSSDTKASGW